MVNFAGSFLGLITLLIWCMGTISVKPTHELITSYASQTLSDAFEFITTDDPNGGYVDYVDRSYAIAGSLVFPVHTRDGAYIGADYMCADNLGDDAKGRKSVWLESQFTFGPGMLMIARFDSMPDRKCGTWPSFYTINGQESAYFTEVDLYEGANLDVRNEMTVWVGGGAGCKSLADDVHFRKDGGAVRSSWLYDGQDSPRLYNAWGTSHLIFDITLVMSIEHDNIRVWRFRQGQEPAEIRRQDTLLDLGSWPAPVIEYNSTMSGCNVGQVFSNQTVALKVNFCGSKAGGGDWERSGCAAKTGMSCEQWVQTCPNELRPAYFNVEYIKLFKALYLKRARREADRVYQGLGGNKGRFKEMSFLIAATISCQGGISEWAKSNAIHCPCIHITESSESQFWIAYIEVNSNSTYFRYSNLELQNCLPKVVTS